MSEYIDIKIVMINVEAQIGSDIGSCLKECMTLSIKEWKMVELRHNDKVYVISPEMLINTIQDPD